MQKYSDGRSCDAGTREGSDIQVLQRFEDRNKWERMTEEYRSSNSIAPVFDGLCSQGSSDEPAKMVNAEKEGTTLDPTHGSLNEETILNDIVGNRTKCLK